MLKLFILVTSVACGAHAARLQTREVLSPTYGTDANAYEESVDICNMYGKTAIHLQSMWNDETHPIWASTTPTTALSIREAMVSAGENLGVVAKLSSCDMNAFSTDGVADTNSTMSE